MLGIPNQLSFEAWHTIQEIQFSHGDDVYFKGKSLNKFGRNADLSTTEETVWLQGGTETYATGNTVDTISSSNAGDTQSVIIEGHTSSGSDLTFVVQSATLNGQNKVVLTTPLTRATRMYNTGSTNFAGAVYVYEDTAITGGVPTDTSKIHIRTDGSNNQSLKCATSTSSVDYWWIYNLNMNVFRQNTRSVDFKLQVRTPWNSGVFRTREVGSASNSSGSTGERCNIIVPPNSDVRVVAVSSGTGTEVSAEIQGYLLRKR